MTPQRTHTHSLFASLICALFALAACGDDAEPKQTPATSTSSTSTTSTSNTGTTTGSPREATGSFSVGNAQVRVEEGQQTHVQIDGRDLLTFAPQPLRTLNYTESFNGPIGIWDFTRSDEERTLFTQPIGVLVEDDVVDVAWTQGDAQASLRFSPGPTPQSTHITITSTAQFKSIEVAFACEASTTFYGFGEQYNALDQRGEAFDLFVSEQGIGRQPGGLRAFSGDTHTTYFPMPWWIDLERGTGLLAETPYRVLVDLCKTDEGEARFEITGGQETSFVMFHGPSMFDLITQLSDVVGRPKTPPEWAFSAPWISAQGGSEAVRAFVDELNTNEVPYSAIWSQDWTGVRINAGGGLGVQYRWEADLEHYPDLPTLIDDLHNDGKRFLAYANPFIDPRLPNHFDEMAESGLLIQNEAGEPYVFSAPNIESSHPDFTNPETQTYVEDALFAMVNDLNIDGWMADFAEWTPLDAVSQDGTDPMAAHNLFPIWWHRANRAAMERARPDGDWVLFARSGWTGVQEHSMIHWIGDQEATWEEHDGLPTVVPAMLNLGLAGVPYSTHDIGGFSGGPSTKELYMRWIELGAFTPIMRTHEGNLRDQNHNWNTDEETLAHFRRFARIHQALLPEWRALSAEAAETSAPMLRPLVLHYPDDPSVRNVSDQFMIGSDLIVAPVVEEGAVERSVVLPAGVWFHVFTGDRYEGPRTVTVEAPVGTPPVFSRGEDRADLRAID